VLLLWGFGLCCPNSSHQEVVDIHEDIANALAIEASAGAGEFQFFGGKVYWHGGATKVWPHQPIALFDLHHLVA
jgi:hypothetical protein